MPDRPTIVFDINETLLDLAALDPLFETHFGDARVRQEWFDQVLQSAFATTVLGAYHDFGTVARSALSMTAQRCGMALSEEISQDILGLMRRLPPHPDVLPGIRRLSEAGFRMAALTNSPPAVARDQMENAGIAEFLEAILSVDASKSLKPARAVYDDTAGALQVAPSRTIMIAAHAWDVAGAMHAGWRGVFLTRNEKVWNPLFESPTFIARDLLEAANWLIEQA